MYLPPQPCPPRYRDLRVKETRRRALWFPRLSLSGMSLHFIATRGSGLFQSMRAPYETPGSTNHVKILCEERGPNKLHFVFPEIIMQYPKVKTFAATLYEVIEKHMNIKIDLAPYNNSGLRMLCSRKVDWEKPPHIKDIECKNNIEGGLTRFFNHFHLVSRGSLNARTALRCHIDESQPPSPQSDCRKASFGRSESDDALTPMFYRRKHADKYQNRRENKTCNYTLKWRISFFFFSIFNDIDKV